MKKQAPWVFFSGGATMGSVSPLLSVWEYLHDKAYQARYVWVGTRKGVEKDVVKKLGIKYVGIYSGKLRRYFSIQNLTDPFFILIGFFQSLHLILLYRPCVVVTSGGFVCVPLAYAAYFLNIPVHVHQQDLEIGLANKLMLPFAKSVSLALPELESVIQSEKNKNVKYTGNPIRFALQRKQTFDDALSHLGFDINPEKPILLVIGGGTGSLAINDLFYDHIDQWLSSFNVIHVTGYGKDETISKKAHYYQREFLDSYKLACAYQVSDIVVTRAGMSTLMELSALQKISVIIPIPDSHQEKNAQYFKKKSAALVVSQKRLTTQKLLQKVKDLEGDLSKKMTFAKNMKNINHLHASRDFAEMIIPFIK